MNEKTRQIAFIVLAAALGLLLLAALHGLPQFGRCRGPYGDLINKHVRPERHCPQSVAAVTFDFRGFDTMGEEFILFGAVLGVTLLMRRKKEEKENLAADDHSHDRRIQPLNDAVVLIGTAMVGVTLAFGAYIVLHGHLTPGGGFQGGVLLATAILYLYLGGEFFHLKRLMTQSTIETLEAIGAGGFLTVGFLGLLAGKAFMQNVLPFGQEGQILSAGFLPVLNGVVGLEVCAGFLIVLMEFLKQAVEIRKEGS